MSYNKSRDLRQFWAAVRHAQRLSDRIRSRMQADNPSNGDSDDEAIAVVPIKESALISRRHLVRRTAR